MTLNDYLSMFPGSTREKPRLMSLSAAVLRQVMDLQAILPDVQAAFTPDNASGIQLDMLGESLGLRRADTSGGATASDEIYRQYIKMKLILWGWDGTNGSIQQLCARLQPGSFVKDNQNGTVTVTGAENPPAAVKDLFPVTAGVEAV